MTKLITDVIQNIFGFIINDIDIWIPTIDYYYKITMKLNRDSVFIKKLEHILQLKKNNQIQTKIIQIYSEEGGMKTVKVHTFEISYNNYLIEYSWYEYSNYYGKLCYNYIIIYKNNNSNDDIADIYNNEGFGSVIDGYHYNYINNTQFINKLNNSYTGFMSAYRLFPTVENATIYEFD